MHEVAGGLRLGARRSRASAPTRRLSRLDLPVLGRPAMPMVPAAVRSLSPVSRASPSPPAARRAGARCPSRRARSSSSGTQHSTSKDCLCASPCTDTTRYCGSRRCRACRISCRRSWILRRRAPGRGARAADRRPRAPPCAPPRSRRRGRPRRAPPRARRRGSRAALGPPRRARLRPGAGGRRAERVRDLARATTRAPGSRAGA